ncbi:hypothetical protein HAZT_HAZT001147 [Hyalella azteca]|uniref:Uncharacterized protein LOC108667321 n=1 Tax=Hyalella azteca TaxID=294128 RepID=A0A6A0HCQ1_HYAAZ|nr:uncharacterized protein LOC108667321 [Hyalella azteca]KAA0203279.1 hypothetical protein HAZT_HAZT001147 [Hyalella azteca]
MITKWSFVFALSLCVTAVLYQVDVVTTRWAAEDYAVIPAPAASMWKFLTNPDTVEKWFHWVSHFRAVDSRPLTVGKRYEALYSIPLLGDYALGLQIVEYVPQRRLVLQSDSLLKPRFSFELGAIDDAHSKLTLKLVFRRNSALFRCTLGPMLWLLSSQRLQHSLFLLKMMFPA